MTWNLIENLKVKKREVEIQRKIYKKTHPEWNRFVRKEFSIFGVQLPQPKDNSNPWCESGSSWNRNYLFRIQIQTKLKKLNWNNQNFNLVFSLIVQQIQWNVFFKSDISWLILLADWFSYNFLTCLKYLGSNPDPTLIGSDTLKKVVPGSGCGINYSGYITVTLLIIYWSQNWA